MYTAEEKRKNRDISNLACLGFKRKEFFETRFTCDKGVGHVLKNSEFGRFNTVYDFCSGHGFNSVFSISHYYANYSVSYDKRHPKMHEKLLMKYHQHAPRINTVDEDIYANEYMLNNNSIVMSIHPCGNLAYRVCDIANDNNLPIVIVPCCHPRGHQDYLDLHPSLTKYEKHELRIMRYLEKAGYEITVKTIPDYVTPRNKIIIGCIHD